MAQSVWSRGYLKNLGYNDGDIGYDGESKALTLKNKPLLYGVTPNSEGKSMVDQTQLNQALNTNDRNDALQQYKNNINKPVQPFSYDMNSIKSDPLYTAGLESLQKDAQTATNQSLVNLGRRGIGNSQSAVTSANAQQQNVVNQANTKLAPQVIAQKYQQYLDANAQQDKQNQNLLGYANAMDGINQQDFNNNRLVNQDERQSTLDARQLQQDHISLADKLSQTYGVRVDPKDDPALAYEQVAGLKTVAQKNQESAAQKAIYDAALKNFSEIGFATPELAKILGIPEGTTTQQARYQQGQLGISQQNANTSATSASNSAGNASDRLKWDKDPNNPDNQYKMAQIGKAQNQSQVSSKDSADNYTMIYGDLQTQGVTKDKAKQLAQSNREYLSDADYKKLLDYIEKQF